MDKALGVPVGESTPCSPHEQLKSKHVYLEVSSNKCVVLKTFNGKEVGFSGIYSPVSSQKIAA